MPHFCAPCSVLSVSFAQIRTSHSLMGVNISLPGSFIPTHFSLGLLLLIHNSVQRRAFVLFYVLPPTVFNDAAVSAKRNIYVIPRLLWPLSSVHGFSQSACSGLSWNATLWLKFGRKKKRSKWLWQLDFAKTISLTLDHVSSLAKEGEMSETDDNSSNWAEASHWLKHCSHNVIQCYTLCHTELYIMLYSVTVLSTRLMIKCAPHWSLTHFDSFHLHNWDSNWYLAKRSRPIPLIIFWCVCVADILKYMRYDK